MEDGGVVVGKEFPIPLKYIPTPTVNILLHAYDIGLLALQVVKDGVEAFFVFVVSTILAHIV
jgi:hypothetical protein